jgi:amino acid transporter
LDLFDAICIIVGIIVGIGIYETAPSVASASGGAQATIWCWLLGGVLSLAGALCYAELATAYPRSGGDYVYLNRAFGPVAGYLFAWAQLVIVRPGSIAAMSFAFARYAQTVFPLSESISEQHVFLVYASSCVFFLTCFNLLGVRSSSIVQNFLTVLKVLGLTAIFAAALLFPEAQVSFSEPAPMETNYGLALILVLFTYGGWNEIAYVAAEIKRPEKNIFRALIIGTLAVSVIYVAINWAFISALGFSKMSTSSAVATESVRGLFGETGPMVIGCLVCLCALGAVHGLILTGSRISYALGQDYPAFALLGVWNSVRSTPTAALIVQAALSLGIIFFSGSFNGAVVYTSSVVWVFFLLTGISLFVLRKKDASVARPFRVPFYPVTPLVFCLSAVYLIESSLSYDVRGSLVSFAILLSGLAPYCLMKPKNHTLE